MRQVFECGKLKITSVKKLWAQTSSPRDLSKLSDFSLNVSKAAKTSDQGRSRAGGDAPRARRSRESIFFRAETGDPASRQR